MKLSQEKKWSTSYKYIDISLYIYVKTSFAYAEDDDIPAVRYPTDVKSAVFRSQLEASHVSDHTEELWYNKTVCLWMTIYIYGGARGVMVIVVGIGHDDTSSNPGREWLHFT